MIRIDWKRKRVNIANVYRVHHGAVAVVLGILCVLAAWHDRADWRDWIPGRDL